MRGQEKNVWLSTSETDDKKTFSRRLREIGLKPAAYFLMMIENIDEKSMRTVLMAMGLEPGQGIVSRQAEGCRASQQRSVRGEREQR